MNVSDYALTYIKDSRELLIGRVSDSYEYRLDIFDDLSQDYSQIKQVKWLKRVSRDDFSAAARNTNGFVRPKDRLFYMPIPNTKAS